MKHANISELRNGLSRYLAYVRGGGVVRVFARSRAVADIVPVGARAGLDGGAGPLESTLEALERRGVVRRGAAELPEGLLTLELPRPSRSVVEALVDEREGGR